jgi:hypothetical protein
MYCVTFIDVLGQRAELNRLRTPRSLSQEDLIQAMNSTLGKVLGLRDTMLHLVWSQRVMAIAKHEVFREFPENVRNWLDLVTRTHLGFQYFSDSLIAYWALPEGSGAATSFALFSVLATAKILMLRSFANRCALRGGIEIGYGIEWEPLQFYGPVLNDAYQLESRIAAYPRVLIGGRLLASLQRSASQSDATPETTFERHWGARALSLLYPDSDGWYVLDFLGIHPSTLAMPDFPALVKSAIAFVRSQDSRFRGDEKLHARYQRLMQYCQKREEEWKQSGRVPF